MHALNSEGPALRQLQPLLYSSEFLDTISTGIVLQGVDGHVRDCNKAAVTLFGTTYEELLARNWLDPEWNVVREDGSPFAVDERPTMLTLQSGESCLEVVMGIDNAGRARRWLLVDTWPLVVDGEVEGVISAFDDFSGHYQERHLLKLLTEINRVVMFATREDECLQELCTVLVEHSPCALVWIGVADDDENDNIESAFAAGATGYLYEGMVSWWGSKANGLGPTGTALRTGISQVVGDISTQPFFEPWRERAGQFGLRSCVAIPFAPGGRKATLNIYDRHVFAFGERTVQGLESIAREIEFGITHVRSVQQVEAALDGTIGALGQMTEIRDPYTAGHQSNVGLLGAAIAAHLGLDAAMGELIHRSGQVHDIGKIAVPAEILTRPGPLSSLEHEMVQRHSLVGADILAKASLPWPIAEVARQHHERLNGSGYPFGLLANEIILPARIIAVADVVETMAHHRPYRAAIGLDIALAEVAAGAGTLFDADVVRACLAVFEAGFKFESGVGSIDN